MDSHSVKRINGGNLEFKGATVKCYLALSVPSKTVKSNILALSK